MGVKKLIGTECPNLHSEDAVYHGGVSPCCCRCEHHLRDFGHPYTNGSSIMVQRGWICNHPEMHSAFSGWPEHGLCECFKPASAATIGVLVDSAKQQLELSLLGNEPSMIHEI